QPVSVPAADQRTCNSPEKVTLPDVAYAPPDGEGLGPEMVTVKVCRSTRWTLAQRSELSWMKSAVVTVEMRQSALGSVETDAGSGSSKSSCSASGCQRTMARRRNGAREPRE